MRGCDILRSCLLTGERRRGGLAYVQGILDSAGFAAEVSAHYVAVEGQVCSLPHSPRTTPVVRSVLRSLRSHTPRHTTRADEDAMRCDARGGAGATTDHHPHEGELLNFAVTDQRKLPRRISNRARKEQWESSGRKKS